MSSILHARQASPTTVYFFNERCWRVAGVAAICEYYGKVFSAMFNLVGYGHLGFTYIPDLLIS